MFFLSVDISFFSLRFEVWERVFFSKIIYPYFNIMFSALEAYLYTFPVPWKLKGWGGGYWKIIIIIDWGLKDGLICIILYTICNITGGCYSR